MCHETPRRVNARRGFSISYKGKTLLSNIDPISQSERIAGAAPKIERTLYFCPSPLLGYGLSRLMESMEPGSALLCVESDEQLMELSRQEIAPEILDAPNFRLSSISDPAELCALVRKNWGARSFRRLELVRLNGGWQLDPELYEALAGALRRDIALDWTNAMTLVRLGRRYIRNAVRNLALIPRALPLSDLDYGDSPVLVLGAGPSLDEFLPLLLKASPEAADPARRPFRIICVDTALPVLYERGIRPDLVLALEAQHWNLRDFTGLRAWEVPLAMDLSALPATADILGGGTFLFLTPWTELRFFTRLSGRGIKLEGLPPLGSVGLSAVELGRRLSSGPIITAGIDFSFTPDASHARASPGHKERLARLTRLCSPINPEAAFGRGALKARSKDGTELFTNPGMISYRDLFEQEFGGDTRLLDTLSSGLPLGIPAAGPEAVLEILLNGVPASRREGGGGNRNCPANTVAAFIKDETESLERLRKILQGLEKVPAGELDRLLDEADYLWAHFPDCAGAGGRRPPGTDISFLKRVRAEIDPLIKCFDLALRELRIY